MSSWQRTGEQESWEVKICLLRPLLRISKLKLSLISLVQEIHRAKTKIASAGSIKAWQRTGKN